jgi:hypothetical protein
MWGDGHVYVMLPVTNHVRRTFSANGSVELARPSCAVDLLRPYKSLQTLLLRPSQLNSKPLAILRGLLPPSTDIYNGFLFCDGHLGSRRLKHVLRAT